MTDANNYVGKALYLEFRKGVNTAQIILTPEGITDKGEYVPSGTWRRQISTWSPKKPWRVYPAGSTEFLTKRKTETAENKSIPEELSKELAKTYGYELLVELSATLNNLFNSEWKLYEKPIVLDFSQEDLAHTQSWDTPTALIRRILRARKELGFSEELLASNPE